MKKEYKYKIYHIKKDMPDNERVKYIFSDLDFLQRFNLKVKPDNHYCLYNGVYEYDDKTDVPKEQIEHYILEDLFTIFNVNHPEDYFAHSMSVSDIVVLDGKTFFCDSFGFKEVDVKMN